MSVNMRVILIFFLFILCVPSIEAQIDPCDFKDKNAISNNKKAAKQYLKARKLISNRKREAAIETLKKAILIDDSCAKCMYSLANQYSAKNKILLARQFYLKLDSTCEVYNPNAYYNVAKIAHFRSKQVQDDDPELLMCAEYFSKYLEHGDPKKSKYHRAAINCRECINLYELYASTVPFKPTKVEQVAQDKSTEYFPFLSPDNESLYFTRKGMEEQKGLSTYTKETSYEKIFVRETSDSGYTTFPLDYPFNQPGITQGAATLTINNQEMYISICDAKELGGIGSCDIFYTKKQHGYWQDFQNLNEISDFPINTENFESMPSISSDGSTLYFISDRHDAALIKKAHMTGDPNIIAQIDFDIFYSVKQENGRWGEVIRLGPEINSARNEKTPFIHPDNRTLYFSSQGHYGAGGYDIFYARKEKNGKWDFAKNIGLPINTLDDDGDFMVSTDGTTGYYASYPSGTEMWEVFEFELHQEAKPKKLVFLKGKVDSDLDPSDANVKIRDNNSGKETNIPVNEDGEYAFIAQIEDEVDDEDYQDSIKRSKNEALSKLDAIKSKLKSKEELQEILQEKPIAPEDSTRQARSDIKVNSTPPNTAAKLKPISKSNAVIDKEVKQIQSFDFTVSTQQEGSFTASKRMTSEDTPPCTISKQKMELKPLSKGATFKIDKLLFLTDAYELTDAAKIELYVVADFLKANPDVKVAVHGHTDNIGSATKNLSLSKNRAQSVHDFLIAKGITANRLQYDGFGPNKPIASNKTEEGRAQNRRTEIVIL